MQLVVMIEMNEFECLASKLFDAFDDDVSKKLEIQNNQTILKSKQLNPACGDAGKVTLIGLCTMKYFHREPILIAIHVFAMTCGDFLKQEFKTADLELSEQFDYKCHLAKVISTLNLNWHMFAVVCFQQSQEN